MDTYEATRMVFSRIQNLEPENASKIIGYLLIQDHGEKEMIRLAFGPEALIHAIIHKAKSHLGLPSSSTPPSVVSTPFSKPPPLSIPISSRLNNGGFSPSSPFTNSPLSYAGIVNGADQNEFVDDFQLQEQFGFLNEGKGEDFHGPRADLGNGFSDSPLHRRSFSVPGMCYGSEDVNSGLGWKPCLYFAKGFCKNGTDCRFVHGNCADGGGAAAVGSPNELQELLRAKALQQEQQQLASASPFMATGASFPYNKCLNFLLQQQQNENQRSAAALMMQDELHKFGRSCLQRNDYPAMGLGGAASPGARQIYLTFPADSAFREEDVSNYFSLYGPVQDVRIPYQQKRMFGFVTFLYPETVKMILAKGNPHFVCDSRVLVKPYKEKGKVLDKKPYQYERGENSSCSSPSGIVDSRDAFELGTTVGPRMFYNNNQDMLMRRRLEEQAELQQALELQGRRLLNLQLQLHHGLPTGSPVPSPTFSSRASNHHARIFPDDGNDQEVLPEENNGKALAEEGNGDTNNQDEIVKSEDNNLPESLEHNLPDNLFASPKKSTGDQITAFSTPPVDANGEISSPTASSSNNNAPLAPPLNSCFLQMPRFSSEHGAIGMYSLNGEHAQQ